MYYRNDYNSPHEPWEQPIETTGHVVEEPGHKEPKKKKSFGGKIVALCLVCALVGGVAGILAIIIALFIFSRCVTKKPASWVFDKIVVAIALVGCLIRLGNLMNSEIYGSVTDLPWGFVFLRNGDTLPSHPTQIYEAGCYPILFVLLMWMYWKKNLQERPWLITGVFFIGIFLPRFLIEYVKNVQEPWEIDMIARCGMNMGQALSLPFIALGIFLVVWAMTHPRKHFEFPNRFADEDKTKGKKESNRK